LKNYDYLLTYLQTDTGENKISLAEVKYSTVNGMRRSTDWGKGTSSWISFFERYKRSQLYQLQFWVVLFITLLWTLLAVNNVCGTVLRLNFSI